MDDSAGAPSCLLNLPRHPAAPPLETASTGALRISAQPRQSEKLYLATRSTQPPDSQIVTSEKQSILLRQFHLRQQKRDRTEGEGDSEEKQSKKKRKKKDEQQPAADDDWTRADED